MSPAIHAAQHERAGHAGLCVGSAAGAAGSTASGTRVPTDGTAILHAQDSASTAAAPQREPRKPLGGTQKAPQRVGLQRGQLRKCHREETYD